MRGRPRDDTKLTYCNPLPLPDYPRGMATYTSRTPFDPDKDRSWRRPGKFHFRETADPTVLYFDNKWYLYPSCGCAYVSEDFVTWEHHRIEPYNPGYAPTVVLHRDKFYLTTCKSTVYESDNPLGPFAEIGNPVTPEGKELFWNDPMLFSDTDGQLYAYWGLGKPGIFGAKLDPENPTRLTTEPKLLFAYNPDHWWERYGEWNEDPSINYNEGPWMYKHEDTYYLTYATPGTLWRTYCMAAYVSKSPLGPFAPQKNNPFLRTTEGLIQGPGHGCLVPGPGHSLWAFYTCTVCVNHIFERRIGMDPVGINAEGELYSRGASQIPQFAPGATANPVEGNAAGLLPLSMNKTAYASSEAPGREAQYAIDNSMKTWWEPARDDASPTLTVYLDSALSIDAVRVIWRDEGLDYDEGVLPGPFRYRIETLVGEDWETVVDKSENKRDMLIEYLTFEPVESKRVRIVLLGWPKGIRPALSDFTAFGASR